MKIIEESTENYLETIYLLTKKQSEVRSIDIANALGYSKPSVSNAMKKLRTKGYIDMEDRGTVSLTDSGRELAIATYDRHCVIHNLLVKLGVDNEIALEDACRMEHVISDETYLAIKKFLVDNDMVDPELAKAPHSNIL